MDVSFDETVVVLSKLPVKERAEISRDLGLALEKTGASTRRCFTGVALTSWNPIPRRKPQSIKRWCKYGPCCEDARPTSHDSR